jgi:hypothetical protein
MLAVILVSDRAQLCHQELTQSKTLLASAYPGSRPAMKPPIGRRSTRVASPSALLARGAHCEAELKELMPMAAGAEERQQV